MPESIRASSAVRGAGDVLRTESGQGGRVRLGRYTTDASVLAGIRRGAQAAGVSFDDLAAKAAVESSFRTDAAPASTSARGLFQMIEQTWLGLVQKYGSSHGLGGEARSVMRTGRVLTVANPEERTRILALRHDPEISARLSGEMTREIAGQLQGVLGRPATVAETYLGYFLGPQGATNMLGALQRAPNTPAEQVLPAAAKSNPDMFNNRETGAALSVSELMTKVTGRLQRAYADLGLQMPQGPVSLAQAGGAGAVLGAAAARLGDAAAVRHAWTSETGWGMGNPARSADAGERAMLAALAEVFARVQAEGEAERAEQGRGASGDVHRASGSSRGVALPGPVLAALSVSPEERR